MDDQSLSQPLELHRQRINDREAARKRVEAIRDTVGTEEAPMEGIPITATPAQRALRAVGT